MKRHVPESSLPCFLSPSQALVFCCSLHCFLLPPNWIRVETWYAFWVAGLHALLHSFGSDLLTSRQMDARATLLSMLFQIFYFTASFMAFDNVQCFVGMYTCLRQESKGPDHNT